MDGPASEGEPGDYVLWDFPWPIFRWLEDTWSPRQLDQWWLTPFIAETHTLEQDSLVCCPDPDERVVMRIERLPERSLVTEELT